MKTKCFSFILVSILLVLMVGCTQPYVIPSTAPTGLPVTPTSIPTPPQKTFPTTTTISPVQKPTSTSTPKTTPPPTFTFVPTPTQITNTYNVTRVIDGDTIKVDIAGVIYDVRYIGMDTPETGDTPIAQEATNYNRQLVEGKSVRLEKDVSETDGRRLLRYVYAGDVFVNAELVRMGFAWAKAYEPDVKYKSYLESMEAEARQAKRGIWTTGAVKITYIFYSGNEYVQITNLGGQPQNLAGWVLKDI